MIRMKKAWKFILPVFAVIFIATCLVMAIPSVRTSIVGRLEQLRTRIFYILNPPEEAVFVPATTVADVVQATLLALTPSPGTTPSLPPNLPTPTPTIPPTPLPPSGALQGVRYQTQHGFWNYCAPANLYMEMSYWGWSGDIHDIGNYVKPFELDKNVMPYELANYVTDRTDLSAIIRYGGSLQLLKTLITNGYPVLIEKGTYITETTTGKISWMGHYNVVTGYDDASGEIIVQDSYFTPDYHIPYALFQSEWRAFNYVLLIVYPPDRQEHLFTTLGEYADETRSYQIAAQTASDESAGLNGNDQFFALFNRGTSLQLLQDYIGASSAYDQAFTMYGSLDSSTRPWRMMWYQTGPYFAYYYTGRYQSVIDLATLTINTAAEPYLEESFIWRARASAALGDLTSASADLCKSLDYHPGFQPSLDEIARLGLPACP